MMLHQNKNPRGSRLEGNMPQLEQSRLETSASKKNSSRNYVKCQTKKIPFIDKEAVRSALSFEQLMHHYNIQVLAGQQVHCMHSEGTRRITMNAEHALFLMMLIPLAYIVIMTTTITVLAVVF